MNSKTIITFVFSIIFTQLSAQVDPVLSKKSKLNGNNSGLQQLLGKHWIKIYMQENYQGVNKVYNSDGSTPEFEKKLARVSCKLSPNTVAYLTVNCTDFKYEIMLTENSPSVVIPDMGGICGIRLDEKAYICIRFNGLETQIHNNDCKRVTGKIVVKVLERQPNSNILYCINTSKKRESVLFNVQKGTTPNFNTFVYNPSSEPSSVVVKDYSYSPPRIIQDSFIVGKSALRDRKVFVKLSGHINSEHKQSDLASDYTDNVITSFSNEFQVNRLPFYNLQSLGKSLIAGPYKATGSNPKGPGYIITKQIRLFFSVLYDFSISGE